MFIYVYVCILCGYQFDVVQSFLDDVFMVCFECGGVLCKQYGLIGVMFNGLGFYCMDLCVKFGGLKDVLVLLKLELMMSVKLVVVLIFVLN